MLIEKDSLKDVEVSIDDDNIITLLNNWCMDDYKLFGSILSVVTNIGDRIVLLNYNSDNNTFLTFDGKASPLNIELVIDKDNDERLLIISKYDDKQEFLYNKIEDNIYITKRIKKQNEEYKKVLKKNCNYTK